MCPESLQLSEEPVSSSQQLSKMLPGVHGSEPHAVVCHAKFTATTLPLISTAPTAPMLTDSILYSFITFTIFKAIKVDLFFVKKSKLKLNVTRWIYIHVFVLLCD